jgi:hypothetical protein
LIKLLTLVHVDPTTISTKRRLSLSYLLDQSDNDPTSSSSSATCLPDQYKLAPISIVSNTKTAYYHGKVATTAILYIHY